MSFYACIFCAVMACSPAVADTRVLIVDAKVDFVNRQIAITGFNFGNGPLNVMLNNAVLPVVTHTPTSIVATSSPIPPAGTYLLDVSVGFIENVPLLFDSFNVTIGTQGPQGSQGIQGVQGPQGQTGPQGSPGNQGLQGAQGQPGSAGAQGSQGPAGAGPATVSTNTVDQQLSGTGKDVASVSLAAGSYVLWFTADVSDDDSDPQNVNCTLSTGQSHFIFVPSLTTATMVIVTSAAFSVQTTVTGHCAGFNSDAVYATIAAIQVSAIH
jgi:Collagen triple helix repeat (20 copies)